MVVGILEIELRELLFRSLLVDTQVMEESLRKVYLLKHPPQQQLHKSGVDIPLG